MARKVLVVDDEKLIVKGIRFSLEQEGMEVDCAYDGQEAFDLASQNQYDIILLDVMLPKMTAKGDDMDKILGLDYGADDYITKPFNILEVKARIKAIIRRSEVKKPKAPETNELSFEELRINIDSRRGYINNTEVNLTAKELDLLELLMMHPNKVYSREELLNTVWGYDYPGDVRTVDVHIRRLREKIETTPSDPKFIHTKWGVGYYFQK